MRSRRPQLRYDYRPGFLHPARFSTSECTGGRLFGAIYCSPKRSQAATVIRTSDDLPNSTLQVQSRNLRFSFAASRAAALIQLCWCVQPMKAGTGKTTRNSNRGSRKLKTEERTATLTLPSPLEGRGKNEAYIRPFAASRPRHLFNWCWCVHPMRAGTAGQEIRFRVYGQAHGRIDEVWMTCEYRRPQPYFNVRRSVTNGAGRRRSRFSPGG